MGENIPKYFCKSCGKEITKEDTICPHCSSDLKKVRKDIKVPVGGVLTFTGSLSIKTIKEFYEKNSKIKFLVIVASIISSFIGLFIAGILGIIIGLIVSVIVYYSSPYAVTKVREIKMYKSKSQG